MQDLVNAVVELMEEEALELTRQYLASGRSGKEVFGAWQQGLAEIGARFEKKEYFVPELILSGELMRDGSEIIKPYLTGDGGDEEKSSARPSSPRSRGIFTISARTSRP